MSEATRRLGEKAPATPPAKRRSRPPRPDRFDLVLVAGITVVYAVVLPASTIPPDRLWLVILCAALLTVPLIWRTRAPVLTWVLVIALQLTMFLTVPGSDVAAAGITYLSPLVGLGAIAARRPVWVSAIALAATYAFMAMTMVVILGHNNPFPDSTAWAFAVSGVVCTIAWGLGVLAHSHHHRLAQLQREHESTRVAVAAERSRIAAELNSIIKEAILSMLRDAASARSAIPEDRDRAIAAFTSIEATGVEAMHELRRLLHLLHDEPSLVTLDPADSRERLRNRWTILRRRRLTRVTRWDVVVTAATIIATVSLTTTAFSGPARWQAPLYFAVALCVLLWRRAFPVAVFLLVIAAEAAAIVVFRYGEFVSDNFTAYPAVLVALAAVAAATPMWISTPALVIAYGYLSLQSFAYPEVLAANLTTLAVLVVAVWLGGMLAGRRRRQIAQLEADGDEARRAVEQERARLAYELHDVIGHSITIMVLQAAGARRIIAHDVDRAVQSLTPIENAGTEALSELDELVRLLSGRPTPVGQRPPLQGLADLQQLVERTRNSVSDITVVVSGQPGRLEPSVDLAAYSVVREALGNAVKHAGLGARIETTLSWSDALVRIEVVNSFDGDEDPPPTDLSGGFGLAHLRERVRIAGGELRWSGDGGVFRVEVVFPVVPSA